MFGLKLRKVVACCFYLGISLDQVTPGKMHSHITTKADAAKNKSFFQPNLLYNSKVFFAKSSKNKPKKFKGSGNSLDKGF